MVHHTVRGTYGTPEAGTCTADVQYGGKLPCASGTYSTQEAGTRSPYVPHGGPGAYVSAQPRASRSSRVRSAPRCSARRASSRALSGWPTGQSPSIKYGGPASTLPSTLPGSLSIGASSSGLTHGGPTARMLRASVRNWTAAWWATWPGLGSRLGSGLRLGLGLRFGLGLRVVLGSGLARC